MLHELLRLRVVVHDRHLGRLVALQHSSVQLQRDNIPPEGRIAGHVKVHGVTKGLDEVVPLHVQQVPAGDLRALVPACEDVANNRAPK